MDAVAEGEGDGEATGVGARLPEGRARLGPSDGIAAP
jgi:hypothetical protein